MGSKSVEDTTGDTQSNTFENKVYNIPEPQLFVQVWLEKQELWLFVTILPFIPTGKRPFLL